MQPSEAIASWHGWLAANPRQASTFLEQLYRRQRELDALFAGEPMRTFPRPAFLSARQHRLVRDSSQVLLDCAERVIARIHDDPALKAQIPVGPGEWELLRPCPGLKRQQVIARPDAFMLGENIQYLEFNAESPAAVAWTDLFEQTFRELEPMQALPWARRIQGSRCRQLLVDALLDAGRAYGLGEAPRVAVVDWREVPTIREHHLVARCFRERGVQAEVVDPREFELRGDALYAGGQRIDLIYRRVILGELLARREEPGPAAMLEAIARDLVCIVNPFITRVPGSKAFMALLSHPRNEHLFTRDQVRMLRAVVPWTRVLAPGAETLFGDQGDLLELARIHRERLVIKPTYSYGGKGVTIGPEAAPGDWDAVIQKAASEPGDWTVQRYVPIPEEPYPVFSPEFGTTSLKVNLNPYLFGGKFAGAIVRLSRSSIINVSAGGGVIPALTLPERSEMGVVPLFALTDE
jgi:glutathionylspermidine synthase